MGIKRQKVNKNVISNTRDGVSLGHPNVHQEES